MSDLFFFPFLFRRLYILLGWQVAHIGFRPNGVFPIFDLRGYVLDIGGNDIEVYAQHVRTKSVGNHEP